MNMLNNLNKLKAPRTGIKRRRFLQGGFAALAGLSLPEVFDQTSYAARLGKQPSKLKIVDIQRQTVRLPFRAAPQRAMDREIPHWRWAELVKVTLSGGVEGVGEGLLYYSWGVTSDENVKYAIGRNAAELMWNDDLGAALQMALFDAVGKAGDVPAHRLLGNQLYDTTPLSWWNIDMPTKDMLSECQAAKRLGYKAYKTKGRPWYDLWDQTETCAAAMPEDFKIDMDFNETLLTAQQAIPILKWMDQFPQIDIYESPIPQADALGNAEITKAVRAGVSLHYGTPPAKDVIKLDVCDGFVIGGGATRLMTQAHVAETADMRFWLQLVGTGVTAAFSLHFGAVCKAATWPAVNCHQLYVHDLLKQPIKVKNGYADVPDKPGLGIEIDWGAVVKYSVEKPTARPDPRRMIETTWPDGRRMMTANDGTVNFMLNPARTPGNMPFFEKGVDSRLLPDDGSDQWDQWYKQSRKQGPTMVEG